MSKIHLQSLLLPNSNTFHIERHVINTERHMCVNGIVNMSLVPSWKERTRGSASRSLLTCWHSWHIDNSFHTQVSFCVYHLCEVWATSVQRFARRHLKYWTKGSPFDLLAAILDDVMTKCWQKWCQSDRDTFDLIYHTTTFGEKWNLTYIWPPGARPFLTPGSRF